MFGDALQAFSSKRCSQWFQEYTEADNADEIGPAGMEKFCEDIALEPENVSFFLDYLK